MSKNSYERIMDWPYHPQMIIAAGFVCSYAAVMQADDPIWAVLIAAALAAPLAGLLLFLPYFISIWILAVLASLLQAMGSRSGARCENNISPSQSINGTMRYDD